MVESKPIEPGRKPLFYLAKYFYGLLAIVVVVLIASSYLWVFSPQIEQYNGGNLFNYKATLIKLNSLKKQKAAAEQVTAEWQQLQQDNWNFFSELLPTTKDIPNIIRQLETIGNQSGLQLTNFSISEGQTTTPDKTAATKPISELYLTVTYQGGDYNNLKQLIGLLENNLRLIDLTSLDFKGNSSGQGFTLNLRTYFFNQSLDLATN